jgi:hypothetical protein
MARGLWGKIEWIRAQPEHIRMRYVLGYLFVSMLFILGIWFLSLAESFQDMRRDAPTAAPEGKDLLPKEGIPSLSGLLEQSAPLQAGGEKDQSGKEYFDKQFPSGGQGEGVPNSQPTP